MVGTSKTLTGMWRGACRRMFFMQEPELQKGSSMTMCFDHMVAARSMEFDLDVWEDLHLTKSRFPVLQRTYLTLSEYEDFLVRCGRVIKDKGAVTKLHANPHKPRGINRTKVTGNYAHGGCIHGWDFRYDRVTDSPQLIMHSRVSYLPYMGGLDLALSYCIAKEIGEQFDFGVEECGFVWHCSSFQYAHMQSVAYTWNDPQLMAAIRNPRKYPNQDYPTVRLMRGTIQSFQDKMDEGFKPEEEKFAQLMRYRRRWESRVSGDKQWGSIPLSSLNLNALRVPRPIVEEEEDGQVPEEASSN